MTEILFRCKGQCKQMLPEDDYPRSHAYKGKTYRTSICRNCRNRKKWPLKTISLREMQPYFNEIISRAGSQRKAAQELRISHTQLRVWLGKQPRYYKGRTTRATRISRKSAAHIINTVRLLRQRDRQAA